MVMSQINMTSITSLVFFLALTTIHTQNECSGGSANCINIRNCPQIISILTDPRPASAQMLKTLRNLQCGFESNDPKYCCNQVPTTTTTTTTTTTVKPEIETPHPPDVTNHPNLRLLDHQACGPVPEHKVISGNETEVFQYPWMALIAYDIGRHTKFRCSGTIISSRYVLTAAECVMVNDFRVIGVRVGDHDMSKERDCITNNRGLETVCAEKYLDFGVDSIHPHPGSMINKPQDDIGLIRLNASIDFTPRNVRPICLPFGTAATLNQKRAIVTGWSLYRDPGKLLQAKFPLMTNKRCKKIYDEREIFIMNDFGKNSNSGKLWNSDITYKHLCTDNQDDGEACWISPGASLQTTGIYNGGSARIIQHGVQNFGIQCIPGNIPGVYIRVSYYMDWILNTMTD